MKYALLLFYICLQSLCYGQLAEPTGIRIYPINANQFVMSTPTGSFLNTYDNTDREVLDNYGGFIRLKTKKFGTQFYNPAQFLRADGTPYSSVSVDAAISAFYSSASISATKIEAATYAGAVSQLAALPTGFAALVMITADESEGNAGMGDNGANPNTFYIYFPSTGLKQLVTFP